MNNTREEMAVANALYKVHKFYEAIDYMEFAKAAIAASNSKYLAGLVEALKETSSLLEAYIKDYGPTPDEADAELAIVSNAQQTLNNLPEELRR